MNPVTGMTQQIIVSNGTPSNSIGRDGQYCYDCLNGLMYGPKASGLWGTGYRYNNPIKTVDQNGVLQPVFVKDGLIGIIDYAYLVSDGAIPNHSAFNKFGFSSGVNNTEITNTPISSGLYVFPGAAQQLEIVSSSVNDVAVTGTGARSIKISYLNDLYATATETVALNGTNPVLTVATNILRINSAQVETIGSGLVAAGNIDIRNIADTPIYGRISAGALSMRQMVYTVPLGKKLFIRKITIGSGSTSGSAFCVWRLRMSMDRLGNRTDDGRLFIHYQGTTQDGSHTEDSVLPFMIPEKTDIRLDVIADAANSNATCTSWMQGWLETE